MFYDNAGYVVKPQGRRLTGRERDLRTGFLELKSAFLFEAEFASPRRDRLSTTLVPAEKPRFVSFRIVVIPGTPAR
jgi:hypothetical protein